MTAVARVDESSEHTESISQSVTPAVMRRLMKEIVELQNNPPEGVRIVTSEDNMLDVTGIIEGPGTLILCAPIIDIES